MAPFFFMGNYLLYGSEAVIVILGAIWLALDAVQNDPDGFSYGVAAIALASVLAAWILLV